MLRAAGVVARPGGTGVLDGLDLAVQSGEVVAITGPSGVGKTTLLHLLAGLTVPDGGQVQVAGHRLDTLGEGARARIRRHSIGFLSQELQLLPHLRADRNAVLPRILTGTRASVALHQVEGLLTSLGLAAHRHKRAGVLSRGQRQRVALVRALVDARPVLLLDEPTSSMDPDNQAVAHGLLRERADAGTAVLFTTHDPAQAQLADRWLVLAGGVLAPAEAL